MFGIMGIERMFVVSIGSGQPMSDPPDRVHLNAADNATEGCGTPMTTLAVGSRSRRACRERTIAADATVVRVRSERSRTAPRYRRGRGASRGERLVLLALALALLLCALASRAEAPSTVPSTRVRVEQGDTLWAIAKQHPVSGLSTEQTADLIARLNSLDAPALVAGSELKVPISRSASPEFASR